VTTPLIDLDPRTWEGLRQSARLKGGNGISLGDCGAGPGEPGLLDRNLMQAGASETREGVNLLGGFEYRRGGDAVQLTPGAQRLVAFLALNQRPLQRVHVAGTLWIDSSEDHANASLRTALWRVQHLRPALVSRTSTHLALADDVPIDAAEIEALAQRVLAGGDLGADGVARLARAKVLLPDWYDDWVVIERERLRQLCLHALEQLSADARADGRYALATEAGLGAVALEPLRESAHRVVIEAYLAEDNASEALHHYRLFERMLDSKLGLRPSPRLQELVRVLTVR
jgi:DNA-binding SARP family transcriptional activator